MMKVKNTQKHDKNIKWDLRKCVRDENLGELTSFMSIIAILKKYEFLNTKNYEKKWRKTRFLKKLPVYCN